MAGCKGDSFGKITFHGHHRISTVDYILAIHELLGIFRNFIVRQPSSFSDHCPLIGWIKTYDSPSNSPSDHKQELVTLLRQFKWSFDPKEKFLLALQSCEWERLGLISDFVNTDFKHLDVDVAVNKFVKILDFAAKK